MFRLSIFGNHQGTVRIEPARARARLSIRCPARRSMPRKFRWQRHPNRGEMPYKA